MPKKPKPAAAAASPMPKKPKPAAASPAVKKHKASPSKRASTAARLATQLVGSATPKTKATRVVAKLDLGGWIDDNWAAPLGVKRPRKPVARLNISRQLPPQWLSKPAAPPHRSKPAAPPVPKKKRGVSSKWDAVPPEVKSDPEDDDDDEEEDEELTTQNYAAQHDEPDTLTYQGRKVRVDWEELLDFLSSKGWRSEKKRIVSGPEATLYYVTKGRRKEDGGKLGQDYFLSHEGVLHYLELHQEIMQDFFDY